MRRGGCDICLCLKYGFLACAAWVGLRSQGGLIPEQLLSPEASVGCGLLSFVQKCGQAIGPNYLIKC